MTTLLEISEMRVKLKALESQIESGTLSLVERCEVEDEILDLKERLGEFDRGKWVAGDGCLNCGA